MTDLFLKGMEEEEKDDSNPLNPGNFKKVKLIPDGACLFTRGMGMSCTWDSERGFGERSWRYSAVIDDGKIEKIFVEVPRVARHISFNAAPGAVIASACPVARCSALRDSPLCDTVRRRLLTLLLSLLLAPTAGRGGGAKLGAGPFRGVGRWHNPHLPEVRPEVSRRRTCRHLLLQRGLTHSVSAKACTLEEIKRVFHYPLSRIPAFIGYQ